MSAGSTSAASDSLKSPNAALASFVSPRDGSGAASKRSSLSGDLMASAMMLRNELATPAVSIQVNEEYDSD